MNLRTPIQTLIAFHIGGLACTPTPTADPTIPTSAATTSASAPVTVATSSATAATPSATPSVAASATPTATASTKPPDVTTNATPPPPGPGKPGTCGKCNPPGYCGSDGVCRMPMLGRPLTVAGQQHVAPTRRGTGWSGEEVGSVPGDEMRSASLAEHASIAAFARTICELMALGAPAWLVDETQRALSDELDHARRTFAMLSTPVEPGPIPAAIAPFAGAGALLRDVFWGGCVGETEAAHRAHAQALEATTYDLSALFSKIAEDESRHAALAFKTARWLVTEHPSLRTVLDEELATFDAAPRRDVGDLIDLLRA